MASFEPAHAPPSPAIGGSGSAGLPGRGFPFQPGGSGEGIRHAIFLAVTPNLADGQRIERAAEDLRASLHWSGRRHPAERLHVSLWSLGAGARLDATAVANGLRMGDAIRWRQFDVVHETAASFGNGGRTPLVFRCSSGSSAALTGLRDALGTAWEAINLRSYWPKAFAPHLTVSYDAAPVLETALAEAVVWRARDLALVHSLQGLGRHRILRRWPLFG